MIRRRHSLRLDSYSCLYVAYKASTLRLALLITLFRCSVKFSCGTIFIPGNFSYLLLLLKFSQFSLSFVLSLARKLHFSLLRFYFFISKPLEQFSSTFLKRFIDTISIIGCNIGYVVICVACKISFVHYNK